MTSPSIAELDCYLPTMSCKAVLTGFTSDLCTWAESEGAGLSVEERQPDKIVIAVQRMLSSSYLTFTVRMDTASQEKPNSQSQCVNRLHTLSGGERILQASLTCTGRHCA